MIYSAVLVLGVQQSVSVIYVHISTCPLLVMTVLAIYLPQIFLLRIENFGKIAYPM